MLTASIRLRTVRNTSAAYVSIRQRIPARHDGMHHAAEDDLVMLILLLLRQQHTSAAYVSTRQRIPTSDDLVMLILLLLRAVQNGVISGRL